MLLSVASWYLEQESLIKCCTKTKDKLHKAWSAGAPSAPEQALWDTWEGRATAAAGNVVACCVIALKMPP